MSLTRTVVEKVRTGEPLTEEEKRQVAAACRVIAGIQEAAEPARVVLSMEERKKLTSLRVRITQDRLAVVTECDARERKTEAAKRDLEKELLEISQRRSDEYARSTAATEPIDKKLWNGRDPQLDLFLAHTEQLIRELPPPSYAHAPHPHWPGMEWVTTNTSSLEARFHGLRAAQDQARALAFEPIEGKTLAARLETLLKGVPQAADPDRLLQTELRKARQARAERARG